MNSLISSAFAFVFCLCLLVSSTEAGRLQYIFHTDGEFEPSMAHPQAVHIVKRSASRSSGARIPCPSFSATRCPYQDLRALCVGHRLNTPCHHAEYISVNI